MNDNTVVRLKNEAECYGCGACIAICPKNAIRKKETVLGVWFPEIDYDLCISCGKCIRVCESKSVCEKVFDKKAYIAYNKNQLMRTQSASGGVFSALATYVLDCGGSVFGAELTLKNGKVFVEHNIVVQIKDLTKLLGSKYVQSDTSKAYRKVKKELLSGRMVLFCGTSCQIVGLKNYLQNVDMSNLYTIDLICHGVPSIGLFNSYISYLQKKSNGLVRSFSFRTKEKGKIKYEIDAQIDDKYIGGGQPQ